MAYSGWYPQQRSELNALLERLISTKLKRKINGIVVPHAGYACSGEIAGKVYSLVGNAKRAVVLGPSHHFPLKGVMSHDKSWWQTPLGKINLIKNNFKKVSLTEEHSLDNQIPFLQKIGIKEILPLVVGQITSKQAEEIAKKIKDFNGLFVISSDLSHFLSYEKAVKKDKVTIKTIEDLDLDRAKEIDACGVYPLLILIHLCKMKGWKPKLVEYKNSGDVTGDRNYIVGYAGLWF